MNAKLVGQLDPYPEVHNRYGDVWGEGNYAYLASYAGSGIMIIDISNPRAPKQVGFYDPENGAQMKDVIVIDGIGYFSSDDGRGLYIVDVRDPKNPKEIANIGPAQQGFRSVHEFWINDGYLFEADSRTRIVKIFDIRNPARPLFKYDIDTTDTLFIHNIFAQNGRLFTSGWSGKTNIYDIRNLATEAPKLLGVVDSGRASHSSWASNDGRLLASCRETLDGDVRLFDVSDPAAPKLLATITAQALGLTTFTAHNPVIVGHLLFVAWYQAGTVVFDISDPTNPKRVAEYDTFPGPIACPADCYGGNWGIYPLLGLDRVLLSDLDGGLFIVDFTGANTAANAVSAASYSASALAPRAIAAAFGAQLANTTQAALTLPLPTTLAGVSLSVQDVSGAERLAPLYFVSPSQINFQVPANTKPGPVRLTFNAPNRTPLYSSAVVLAAAPSIFTVDQSGKGAAVALDAFTFTPAPFAVTRANGEPNYLAVFANGLGNDATDTTFNANESVKAWIDDQSVALQFAGSVPGLSGLNQINLALPAGLTTGTHRLRIARNGLSSNETTIQIK